MATSQRKIESNRTNGKKSRGPIDRTRTRLNGTRHGLLAAGITQLDDAEGYQKLVRELRQQMSPVGALENFLLEAVASDLVRLPRARRFESEYITEILNPTKHERDPLGEVVSNFQGRVVDPGMPASLKPGSVQCLVNIYQRYETLFANRLFRTLHELDRLQRMRRGEYVSTPISVDVSVHATAETHDSPPTAMEQPITAPLDSKSLASPVTLDSNSQANIEVLDSAPAASEEQKPLPGDGESLPAPVTHNSTRRPDNESMDSVPAESQKKALPEWKAGPPPEPIWRRR